MGCIRSQSSSVASRMVFIPRMVGPRAAVVSCRAKEFAVRRLPEPGHGHLESSPPVDARPPTRGVRAVMLQFLHDTRTALQQEVTIRLLKDRYLALTQLRQAVGGGDRFPARMLGRQALVVRGEEGVRAFYDPELVTRRGAVPAPV